MESKAHIKAKNRLADILRSQPDFQNISTEHRTGVMVETSLGVREYVADVYAEHGLEIYFNVGYCQPISIENITLVKLCLEVDGRHHSKKSKDDYRDAKLKAAGITTVRFRMSDLVGRKALKDNEPFLQEIREALNK